MTQPDLTAVLFDLDGTLIDTAPDFIRIITAMCDELGRPVPTERAIRSQVSAGARAMVKLMFAGEFTSDEDPLLLQYRQLFLERYEADICVDSQLFAGLDELLTTLEQAGIAWGIVTNKPRHLATLLLERLGLAPRCAVLVCPDDVTHTKPDPEPLLLACQRLGLAPAQSVYVGDHSRDIKAGQAAGMPTIIAGYGYIAPDDAPIADWDADHLVATPDELAVLIKSMTRLS